MHEAPKKPLTKQIRAYKAEHPNVSYKEIAEALGTTYQYVYTTLNGKGYLKKNVGKQAAEKPVKNKELENAKDEIETLRIVVDAQQRTIVKNMAVIEYLEGKIDDLGGLVC